jgi:hypothetical protein
MKKRRLSILCCFVLILFGLLLLTVDQIFQKEKRVDPVTNNPKFTESEDARHFEPDIANSVDRPSEVSDKAWRRIIAQHEAGKSTNAVIKFYGFVHDQEQRPIEGVEIVMLSSAYNEDFSQVIAGWESAMLVQTEIRLKTDSDGMFSVEDINGRGLDVQSVKKSGYRSGSPSHSLTRNFNFGPNTAEPHNSSRTNPTKFEMWKIGDTEPLINTEFRISLSMDPEEREKSIFFLSGNKIAGSSIDSNLTVKLDNRSKSRTGKFDWAISLLTPTGGIMESNDAYLFRATDKGYQSSYTFEMLRNDPNWRSGVVNKKFYIKGGNPVVFAAIVASFRSFPDGRGRIILEAIVNPSGSRNLEYDPEKDVTEEYHGRRQR